MGSTTSAQAGKGSPVSTYRAWSP